MSPYDYDIDDLGESMVRILNPENNSIEGSGFIIRDDGYIVTCHHVIYLLEELKVECQRQTYDARWCSDLSNPEVDIAILKINIRNAKPVPIVQPHKLPVPVIFCGFPQSREDQFPEGFDIYAESIDKSSRIRTMSTYDVLCVPNFGDLWNVLPGQESSFSAYKASETVDWGFSGGPAFSKDLAGAVGVIPEQEWES
jgi:hypothetical protein